MTWSSTETVVDALVQVGGAWLRVSAIDAVERASSDSRARVHLRGGRTVVVCASVDDVMAKVRSTLLPEGSR
jgi:hypothetical protein